MPDTVPFTPTNPVATNGEVTVRVRYVECDPMGVAHHGSYIPWLEMARTELLRTSGVTYADMERAGYFLVVTRLDVRYRRPIRYDDVVAVRVRVSGTSRVKIEHEYDVAVVERAGAACDEPVGAASTTLACVGRDGRIQELPAFLTPA